MNATAIVLAAGKGLRMGNEENKIFLSLGGYPVLYWSLKVFEDCPRINQIVVAAAKDEIPRITRLVEEYGFGKVQDVVVGGETRAASVKACLSSVSKNCRTILVHDGARPLLTMADMEKIIDKVAETHQGAILGVPLSDTLHQVGENMLINNTVIRSSCWQAQTPQGFPKGVLLGAYAAYDGRMSVTDDATLVRAIGGIVRVIQGSRENIKITDPIDLKLAETILAERENTKHGCGNRI